jgi:N-acetyl-anhydromuramoyl-L-alanine amidase
MTPAVDELDSSSLGNGWLPRIRRLASPNFDERPADAAIDLLLIHYISLPPNQFTGDAVERFFTNQLDASAHPYFETIATLKVSAHFFLRRSGELIQLVSCNDRAWHAGESKFLDRERCNNFSIGVELEGSSERAFTAKQYRRLARLTLQLAKK